MRMHTKRSHMRKMGLRSLGACAMVGTALALTAFSPSNAYAAEQHDISNGNVIIPAEDGECPGHVIAGYTDSNRISVTGGKHKITLDGVSAELVWHLGAGDGASAFNIDRGASVELTLKGENRFKGFVRGGMATSSQPGIRVASGASLTIDGNGSLVATGATARTTVSEGAAGIGGAYNEDFGDITINGGNIEAHAAGGGAGIGGGYKAGSGTATGNVTITGGYVQAFGDSVGASSGAGIGAGENADYSGTITISGGVVRAMGGDSDQSSIGGGGTTFGSTNNGTFTTGENGNAVIAAPWGIGDTSGIANWDCILIDRDKNNQEGLQNIEYSVDGSGKETVKFVGGTPQVYGDVAADYNIVVESPANLRVTSELDVDNDPSTPNNLPSTLTMKAGTTLTNNNKATDPGIAGIALDPGSTLVLEEGTSQCLGEGKLLVTGSNDKYGEDVVKLPLSDDMVSVSPESYEYDGTAREPAETVAFNKWGYKQTFEKDVDYTLEYKDNINVGAASAVATSKDGGDSKLLRTVEGEPSNGTASFEITLGDFEVSTVSRRYVQKGEDELLSKLPTKPEFGDHNPAGVEDGEFKWFSDKDCTTPLTDDFVANEETGARIAVFWKYTQKGNPNCVESKTGSTVLVITDQKPPAVKVDGIGDNIFHDATYGDASYTPSIQISLDGGSTWVDPSSEVTFEIYDEQKPAKEGDVVKLDGDSISFVGAGGATVLAHIDGYTSTDPDGTGNYGSAYVTIDVHVSPAQVKVDEASVHATDRSYDGTRNVEVTASLAAEGIVGNDGADGSIGLAATGKVDNRNVASDVPVTVTYELTGAKADDYELTNSPNTTVDITKAQAGEDTLQGKTGELVIANGAEATYVFDLRALAPDSKPVEGEEGAGLYPGRIYYRNPVVSISDDSYFTADDIRIDDASSTMYLTVHDVDSTDEGELGTITFDMECPNFVEMKGTIKVSRENAAIYTVEASADEGGSITPDGAVEVVEGHDQTFTVAADEGYEIADVKVDGESVGAVSEYTFEDVVDNHTIEASFKQVDEDTGDEGDHGSGDEQGGSGEGDEGGSGETGGSQDGTSDGQGSGSDAEKDASAELPATGDSFNALVVGGIALVGCALVAAGTVKACRRS